MHHTLLQRPQHLHTDYAQIYIYVQIWPVGNTVTQQSYEATRQDSDSL